MRTQPANCPECGAENVTTTWEIQVIPYGDEGDEISTNVPVRHCKACSFDWLDHEAEDIRDEAVSEAHHRKRH